MSHFIFNIFKRWYVILCANEKCEKRIYAAPAVKGSISKIIVFAG